MRIRIVIMVLWITVTVLPAAAQVDLKREQDIMSSMGIAGFDPKTGEVGVACASRVFAVGPVMAHVRAGVGAIATMGGAPYNEGEMMLDWMEQGASPDEVVQRLRQRHAVIGQMSIVDAKGRSLAVTENPNLSQWNGHRIGKNYAASGNILAGPDVVNGFADTFERTEASGLPLAERLMMALEAADQAGGDARGRMGAIIQVYKQGAGYVGTDLYLDLRIDDSPHSIADLRNLYERWKVERIQQYGSRIIVQTDGNDVQRLQTWLLDLGYVKKDNRAIFNEKGDPRGVFNDATVDAVLAFKKDYQLGESRDANREVVIKMIQILENRARARGITSFWK